MKERSIKLFIAYYYCGVKLNLHYRKVIFQKRNDFLRLYGNMLLLWQWRARLYRGMQGALALGQTHGAKLKRFLNQNNIKPFINDELAMALEGPIRFVRPGRGGKSDMDQPGFLSSQLYC